MNTTLNTKSLHRPQSLGAKEQSAGHAIMQNKAITAIILTAGLGMLAFLTLTKSVSPADSKSYLIVLVCLTLWATGAIPAALTSFIFFVMVALLTDLAPHQIFSGFTSSAFWLVVSGSVMSFAIRDSGLSDRIGIYLTNIIGQSYARALFTFSLLSFFLALAVPSTFGRISILVPIAMGYCQTAGIKRDSPGYIGVIMLTIVSAFEVGSGLLPANLPNLIMAAGLEATTQKTISYAEYFYLFSPSLIILRSAVLLSISYIFFSIKINTSHKAIKLTKPSQQEILIGTLITTTIVFWATDKLHNIQPGWIGITFCLIYLATRRDRTINTIRQTTNASLLIYIAATIGLTVLISNLEFLNLYPQPYDLTTNPIKLYIGLTATSLILCILFTSNAAPAIYTPLVGNALGHSIFLKTGVLTQVPAYSTVLFPYQAPPIVYGIVLASVNKAAALKYCVLTGFAGLIIVIPANAAWWWLLDELTPR